MKLSIIIVNWNTRDMLSACLESVIQDLEQFAKGTVETIVVDNASDDDSVSMVKRQFPWAILAQNRENIGFARANNQAIEISQGEYILLLNSDTIVKTGALYALVDFLDKHPGVGIAGSRLLNPDGSLQESCHPAITVTRELWRLIHLDRLIPLSVYRMAQWPTDIPRLVDNVQGASMLLRRTLIEEIGVLDEQYFMYTEEVDLCQRARSKGWSIYWIPDSQIIHFGGQSSKQIETEMFLHLYLSKIKYIRKHYGRLSGWLYKLVLSLISAGRLFLSPFAWFMPQVKRNEYLTLAGHYRLLLYKLPRM